MTQPCTLVEVEATNPDGFASHHWGCDLNPNDRSSVAGYTVQLMGYNFSSGKDNKGNKLRSGKTTFYAPGVSLVGPGNAHVPSNSQSQAVFAQPSGRRLAVVTGTKTVLAIRVASTSTNVQG